MGTTPEIIEKTKTALDSCDSFVAVTVKELDGGRAEITVYRDDGPGLRHTIIKELLVLVRRMLYGDDELEGRESGISKG